MSEKMKNNTNFVLQLIKSAIIGVVVSILLVLLLAFILKFVELSDNIISVIDEFIKIISVFVAVVSLVKKSPYKILIKGILVGMIYSILTFIVFSALGGGYSFSLSTLIDVLLGGVTGAIIAIILNVFTREKITA